MNYQFLNTIMNVQSHKLQSETEEELKKYKVLVWHLKRIIPSSGSR